MGKNRTLVKVNVRIQGCRQARQGMGMVFCRQAGSKGKKMHMNGMSQWQVFCRYGGTMIGRRRTKGIHIQKEQQHRIMYKVVTYELVVGRVTAHVKAGRQAWHRLPGTPNNTYGVCINHRQVR